MPDIWRVYLVRNCCHTHPSKDKFVVIMCRDIEFMGFLINSKISKFVLKKPDLLACQVILSTSDYGFLSHDSYLDCSQIYPFGDTELVIGRERINEKTKSEIKNVVSTAKTIEKHYKNLILIS